VPPGTPRRCSGTNGNGKEDYIIKYKIIKLLQVRTKFYQNSSISSRIVSFWYRGIQTDMAALYAFI